MSRILQCLSFLFLLLLLAGPAGAADGQSLTLLYSGDMRGYVLPCES